MEDRRNYSPKTKKRKFINEAIAMETISSNPRNHKMHFQCKNISYLSYNFSMKLNNRAPNALTSRKEKPP